MYISFGGFRVFQFCVMHALNSIGRKACLRSNEASGPCPTAQIILNSTFLAKFQQRGQLLERSDNLRERFEGSFVAFTGFRST